MLFRSNLVPIMVRYQLGVILEYIFLFVKFYRYTFFDNYSINKIQTFVFLFSSGFQILSPSGFKEPCGFKKPSWIQETLVDFRLFSEANMFCFLFSRGRRVLLLNASTSCISWYQNLDLSWSGG